MGQSKSQKQYNQQMASNAQQQLQLQREMFDHTRQETPEQKRFREGAANWDTWIKNKNYGAPPTGELLNFDLYNPSRVNELRGRMDNITGVGAAALSGSGDQSIALQQSRDRASNQMAMDAGNAYENAVKQTDSYYKSNGLAWSAQDTNKNLSLLNNTTGSAQFFFGQQARTLPPSFFQVFSPIMGGALSAGGALLGNTSLFGGGH
jgi:hypothetical protein